VCGARADDAVPGEPAAGRDVNVEQHVEIGMAALNLYTAFGCVGLVAEGWDAELYDAAKVERIMKDISRTSNLAVQMLLKSIEQDPSIAKTTPISEIIHCYQLVDRQAQLLTEAAKSTDEKVEQVFRKTRDECWDKMAVALGIEP
jgi:hypothetical protein